MFCLVQAPFSLELTYLLFVKLLCVDILCVSNKSLMVSLQNFPSLSFLDPPKWWLHSLCRWDPDLSLKSQSWLNRWQILETSKYPILPSMDMWLFPVCVFVAISPLIQVGSPFVCTNCSNLTRLRICWDLLCAGYVSCGMNDRTPQQSANCPFPSYTIFLPLPRGPSSPFTLTSPTPTLVPALYCRHVGPPVVL